MTTNDVITADVTVGHTLRRDVSNRDDDDWLMTTMGAVSVDVDETGCQLYSFVISSLLIGFLIVFGLVGNSTAFLIFQRDTLKTSTSFLFQVSCLYYFLYCTVCNASSAL